MSVVYKPLIGLASATVFGGLNVIMSWVQIKFPIYLLLAFRQKKGQKQYLSVESWIETVRACFAGSPPLFFKNSSTKYISKVSVFLNLKSSIVNIFVFNVTTTHVDKVIKSRCTLYFNSCFYWLLFSWPYCCCFFYFYLLNHGCQNPFLEGQNPARFGALPVKTYQFKHTSMWDPTFLIGNGWTENLARLQPSRTGFEHPWVK